MLTVQVADVLTVKCGGQGIDYGALRNAQYAGACAIYADQPSLCRVFHAVIDIDNVRGLFKNGAHPFGCFDLLLIVQAIDLCNQWGKDGRPRWHFDNFYIRLIAFANRL